MSCHSKGLYNFNSFLSCMKCRSSVYSYILSYLPEENVQNTLIRALQTKICDFRKSSFLLIDLSKMFLYAKIHSVNHCSYAEIDIQGYRWNCIYWPCYTNEPLILECVVQLWQGTQQNCTNCTMVYRHGHFFIKSHESVRPLIHFHDW